MEIKKFITYGSNPTKDSFPELPKYLTWLRLVLGFFYGVQLGVKDANSSMSLFFGVSLVTFLPLTYVDKFLKGNSEAYGNITFAGVPNAMALLILTWMTIWTYKHPEEELLLSASLVKEMTELNEEDVETLKIESEAEF